MEELEQHFRRVYTATYADLVRFAARRVDSAHAEDVVAETFVVAWRRRVDFPATMSDARGWLFGITRRILLAQHRQQERGQALAVRLAHHRIIAGESEGHEDDVISAVDIARAWNKLSALHQETLALTVLDDLSGVEAASVLGISPVAYRLRLMRARRAMSSMLAAQPVAAALDLSSTGICLKEGR